MTRTVRPTSDDPIAVLTDREGIGDVLVKMPLVRALARSYPGHPVWWIASNQTAMADLMRPYAEASIVRVLEHTHTLGPRAVAAPALRALPRFSLVFDTRTRVASVWRARRHLRCEAFFTVLPGYALSRRRPPGRWLRPRSLWRRMLSLAEAAVDMKLEPGSGLPCSDAALAAAAALLPAGPVYVGLAPGSREARKNWPIGRYVALAGELVASGVTPVFILGPFEEDLAAQVTPAPAGAIVLRLAAFPDVPRRGALDPAIAICRRLALMVANDGGMGHTAGAVGVPVVSLFGPTDPQRWAPCAPGNAIVAAAQFGSRQMDAIPVAAVRDAALALLKPGAPR
jgi:ADP-heptose:LPS heptosyltransferase